jgi:hypothetical protein
MKIISITVIIVISLCVLFTGNTKTTAAAPAITNGFTSAYTMIEKSQSILKDGDLVVRMNQDLTSHFIKYFNRQDKRYSHSAIVIYENGYPYVYHIVNGDENPDKKLRKDSLYQFCNPKKNFGYGIYRYTLKTPELKRLKKVIHKWYAQEIKFDSVFSLKTDNLMYCSEMIKKALEKATGSRIIIETTKLTRQEAGILSSYLHLDSTYTKNLKLIAIDNLYMNEHCSAIANFDFHM